MEFAITPAYKDIFKEEPPEISTLLADIPSKLIISFFSAINATLFLEREGAETQVKILKLISRRFTPQQIQIISNGLLPFLNRGEGNLTIFATWYCTEFIAYELLNYRDIELVDTNPEQEYRIFKAYLIIVERLNKEHEKLFETRKPLAEKDKELFFEWNTWGMISKQFDFNNNVEPLYQAMRSVITLDFLSRSSKTKIFVENFLKAVNRKSFWHYVFDFLNLVQISFKDNPLQELKPFAITSTPEFDSLLESLCIDAEKFQADITKYEDYKGLREKPLIHLRDNQFIVMNWTFLYSQIYLGLLHDFFERSGIKEKFKRFDTFRSFIADHVSEKILFAGLADASFHQKHSVIHFDDGSDEEIPDCYLRIGKYIFLFEFKDALMPIRVIQSSDYEKIKEDIEKKFIVNEGGKNKGIKQLLSHAAYSSSTKTIELSYGKGFSKEEIFEEFFHAGQDDYYSANNIKRSSLANEVEAKVANIVSGYGDEAVKGSYDAIKNYFATGKKADDFDKEVTRLINATYEIYANAKGEQWSENNRPQDVDRKTLFKYLERIEKINKKQKS